MSVRQILRASTTWSALITFKTFLNVDDLLIALDRIRCKPKQPGKPENIGNESNSFIFVGQANPVKCYSIQRVQRDN